MASPVMKSNLYKDMLNHLTVHKITLMMIVYPNESHSCKQTILFVCWCFNPERPQSGTIFLNRYETSPIKKIQTFNQYNAM